MMKFQANIKKGEWLTSQWRKIIVLRVATVGLSLVLLYVMVFALGFFTKILVKIYDEICLKKT